jgi:hexulose-6-phosphate isomerase
MSLDRRAFLTSTALAATPLFVGTRSRASALAQELVPPPATPRAEPQSPTGERPLRGRILKAVKWGMIGEPIGIAEKLRLLQELGFDGVELDSPTQLDLVEARRASEELGFPIHGVVDSTHWQVRHSDPDPAVRARALADLETALRDSLRVGGSAVLLVPGRVADKENENAEQVWERSRAQIQQALPLAAKLGQRILIENVWNGFLYDPDGGAKQSAELLVRYLDSFASPWVGSYFDIGNHQRYGQPAEWIRTLGPRIVKLDCKDWGKEAGFCKIGDGDVDWAAVRAALSEIGFTGWCTAEVQGGDRARLQEIAERMDRVLGL